MKKILKVLTLILIILLCSCGARRSHIQKILSETEKESTKGSRKEVTEEILETVVTETDTIITLAKKQAQVVKPLAEVLKGESMVYEDNDIRSETKYDKDTGTLKSTTTRKEQKIPVKQRETTERTIKRDMSMQNHIHEKELGKVRTTDKTAVRKENFSWWWLVVLLIIYACWRLFRKYNPMV